MKHKSVWVGVALLIPTGIHGATWVTPSCCSVNPIAPSTTKCKSVTRKVECGSNITIVDCGECQSGYSPYQAKKPFAAAAPNKPSHTRIVCKTLSFRAALVNTRTECCAPHARTVENPIVAPRPSPSVISPNTKTRFPMPPAAGLREWTTTVITRNKNAGIYRHFFNSCAF